MAGRPEGLMVWESLETKKDTQSSVEAAVLALAVRELVVCVQAAKKVD